MTRLINIVMCADRKESNYSLRQIDGEFVFKYIVHPYSKHDSRSSAELLGEHIGLLMRNKDIEECWINPGYKDNLNELAIPKPPVKLELEYFAKGINNAHNKIKVNLTNQVYNL